MTTLIVIWIVLGALGLALLFVAQFVEIVCESIRDSEEDCRDWAERQRERVSDA